MSLMKIITETTKNNKKNSEARTAHLQMMMLTFVLAILSFAAGYYSAMAEIAQVILAN